MNIFNSIVTYKDSVYHADGIRCWSNKRIIIKAKRKKTAEELYCEHFASKEYYYINALMRLEITLRKTIYRKHSLQTKDIPYTKSDYYSFPSAVDSYFGIERSSY